MISIKERIGFPTVTIFLTLFKVCYFPHFCIFMLLLCCDTRYFFDVRERTAILIVYFDVKLLIYFWITIYAWWTCAPQRWFTDRQGILPLEAVHWSPSFLWSVPSTFPNIHLVFLGCQRCMTAGCPLSVTSQNALCWGVSHPPQWSMLIRVSLSSIVHSS